MPVSLKSLGLATGGGIMLWTGLTSKTGNPRDILSALLAGRLPPGPAAGAAGGGNLVTGASASGAAIASDALSYVGKFRYVWGGAPAAGGSDCSGFANWILGHDFGLAIPGYAAGTYDGTSHGPTTVQYLLYGQPIARAAAAAGDLAVWQTHMGIFIDGTSMVSAENPAAGTQTGTVDGFIPGEVLFCRRITQTAAARPIGGRRN